jgi:hypothetical protein
MVLTLLLRITNPCLKNILRFLYELAVQINSVVRNSSWSIVLPEDVVRCLLVVLVHFGRMLLAFLRQLMRGCAIAALVCLTGLAALLAAASPLSSGHYLVVEAAAVKL